MAELAKQIGRYLPYLRRYARAITGAQEAGDRAVKLALQRLLQAGPTSGADGNLRLALYRSLHDVIRDQIARPGGDAAGSEHFLANGGILAYRVEHLAPPKRQFSC